MDDKAITTQPEVSIEQQNHDYCQETLRIKQSLELHFLELGKRLFEIREGKLFEPYWDSFTEYLMEMRLDATKASRLVNIYKTFVLKYEIEPQKLADAGGWSVLAEVLPMVKDKESADEWVEKATLHPQHELRDEIRESRDGRVVKRDKFADIEGEIAIKRTEAGLWYGRVKAFDDLSDDYVTRTLGPLESLDQVLHHMRDYE